MDFRDLRRGARFGPILIVIAFSLIGSCARAAEPAAEFNIPAGDAVSTLYQFHTQSGVEIVYLGEVVAGVQTRTITGRLKAPEALAQMLDGTGLTFYFPNEREAVVSRAAPATADAEAAVPSATPPLPVIAAASPSRELGEMVVTGSNIRGVLDLMSPLEIITKQQMKRTAYATVQDAIQTLPISSGAVQGEDFAGNGNFGRGSSISLRGLGAGATLVLVNGRRQPQAGMQADFVDVSNIPWSAVDRIEVLPDGSSALYGSDAIAGVVNVIMREDLEGAESQVRFGTASNGAAETVAAQLFGHRWDTGQWLFDYQYTERTALAAADRAYTANADKRAFGGRDFRTYRSNPGNILDPRTFLPVFAIPQGQDGTSLTAADLLPGTVNLQNQFETVQLLPAKEIHSVFLTGKQRFGERLELFGEGRYSRRDIDWRGPADEKTLIVPATNPFFVDPFGGSPFVIVAYNFLDDIGPLRTAAETRNRTATLGGRLTLSDAWQATLSRSSGKESLSWVTSGFVDPGSTIFNQMLSDPNPSRAFNPFGDGSSTNPSTLEAIGGILRGRVASQIDVLNLVADGPLFNLPAGTVKIAIGIEHRRENLTRKLSDSSLNERSERYGRQISAAFAELSVPLVSSVDHEPTASRLELSLAGRYEEYSDFGNTFNPKFGLRWIPRESLKLRTSWSTSFKAPKLTDLYDTSQNASGIALVPDPLSPTGQSFILFNQGSNPALSEETATNWTMGIDFAPRAIPGLTLSLTGYAIEHRGQVIQPGGLAVTQILFHEDQWAEVITRNPSRSQIVAFCSNPNLFGDRSQCENSPAAAIIDTRLRNLASTQVKGLDIKLKYALKSNQGYFNFGFDGSYVSSFKQALTRSSSFVDVADTPGNPLTRKLSGAIEWNQRAEGEPGFGANLIVKYIGGYENTVSPVRKSVASWTMFDFGLSYRTTERGNKWGSWEFGLNAANIFDEDPPFVDRENGYDDINAEPVGRVVSLYIRKNWGRD